MYIRLRILIVNTQSRDKQVTRAMVLLMLLPGSDGPIARG